MNYNIQNCSIDNLKFILFSISSNTSNKQISILNNTDCPNIPDLLNDIPNLYSLSVMSSNFVTLTDSIGEIKDITNINLMNLPYLASLPVSIGSLSTLASLNITNSASESIPPLNNKNLTTLSIQDNSNLTTLPELNNLPNLKYLRISNNNISVLPDSIKSLQSLEYLYIDEKLESIPDWIGKLQNLNSLSIINTNINSIPSSISNLANLMNLEIKTNHNLHDLPESLGDLVNLQMIDLIFIKSFVLPRSFEQLMKNNNIQLSIQLISS